MTDRIHKQRGQGSSDYDDDLLGENTNPQAYKHQQGALSHVSGRIDDTVGSIDDVLNDNDNTSEAMDRETHNGTAEDLADQEGLYKGSGDTENHDGPDSGAMSPGELNSAETTNPAQDAIGKGYTGGDDQKNIKIKSRVKKRRRFLMIAAVPSGGVVAAVVLLLLFASSLKIPNLAQNIVSYQLARITRQFARSAERVTVETLATSAVEARAPTTYEKIKARLNAAGDRTRGLLQKLDKYQPSKVFESLGQGEHGAMQLKFINGQFTAATINGRDIPMQKLTGLRRIPGASGLFKFNSQIQFSRDFAPALQTQLRTTEAGPLIRGLVAKRIRQQLGIGLMAWTIGKYKGKTVAEARVIQVPEQATAIEGRDPQPVSGNTSSTNAAAEDAVEAEKKALANPKAVQEIIDNKGWASSVRSAIGNALDKTPFSTIVDAVSPVAALVPACIVYDGSIDESGPLMDQSSSRDQSAFYYIASAGDQQKAGSQASDPSGDGLATAINAADANIGDISTSNPQVRASGGYVNTSDGYSSAEASGLGEFTLFDATGLPSVITGALDTLGKACPVITNPWANAGLTLAQAVLTLFPPTAPEAVGAAASADAVAGAATKVIEDTVVPGLVQRLLGKTLEKLVGEKIASKATTAATKAAVVKNMVLDGVKDTGKIVLMTVAAKMIVAARAGQLHSGTAESSDLANMADSGANIHQSELERTQLFGRPLMQNEVCQSNQEDVSFINHQESQKSTYDRYFALDNAQSLLSRTASGISMGLGGSISSVLVRFGNTLLKPFSLLNGLGSLLLNKAFADSSSNCQAGADSEYGNVQFGWSDAEEALIDGDGSYQSSLENQALLDDPMNDPNSRLKSVPDPSQVEKDIASTYSACFGYTYDGGDNLDPSDDNSSMHLAIGNDEEGSIGSLLSNGDITRDANANIIDDPNNLCSPTNLGPNNPTYGDLVFRWRLAMQYDYTRAQLISEQSVTSS